MAEQSNPPEYTDDASTINDGTDQSDVEGKKMSKKEEAVFKDGDARTIVEGKGRRDVNGKIMTKKEVAAEDGLRILLYSCVVM
jgi:hypothetical protein